MQSFRMLGAIAAGAVFAAGAAHAEVAAFKGQARLVTPATASREAIIAGVAWRCEGADCLGSADRKANLDGLVRECRKVVEVIGPVASYRSGGRDLTDSQLRACNRAAAGTLTAHN